MSVEIIPIPPVNADARREIFELEIDSPPSVRRTVLVVKGVAKLGNHYHRELTEHFLLAEGRVTLVTRDVDEDGVPHGNREVTEVTAPSLIVMPPPLHRPSLRLRQTRRAHLRLRQDVRRGRHDYLPSFLKGALPAVRLSRCRHFFIFLRATSYLHQSSFL